MKNNKRYFVVWMQISLLISMTFSVSYFMRESYSQEVLNQNPISYFSIIGSLYKSAIKLVFSDKNFVSAEILSVNTCLVTKTGSVCQEFTSADACNSACSSTCIPSSRKDISECKMGTCYDKVEGTCQAGSPKAICEKGNGQWLDDPNGNNALCKRGCCVLGDRTFFSSDQQCANTATQLGIQKNFKPEINTELACLILSNSQEEGACVFEKEFENTCKFTTKASCIQMTGNANNFHSGLLCSNPDLKTNCKKQATSQCVDGKDEIYWFDSCGNKENIYDANKVKSYNDGKVLSKNESCSLSNSGNQFANQGSCGNCNYLLGSKCNAKTTTEKLSDSTQQFICKSLNCKDAKGNVKLHGESWCAYNGAIGTDKGSGSGKDGKPLLRSVDTPGSRDFRQVCIDGEVRTEPCADYRNEICVQSNSPLPNGKTFSAAACKLNQWQACTEYNTEIKTKKNPSGISTQQRDDKCSANPDCFVKSVNIDKKFKFNICAPKYAPGFDLLDNGDGAEGICSLGTQSCTAIYVKGLSGWKCKVNCGCTTKKFTEQMNDLCMSLGDCGASVNYEGDLSQSYKVSKAPKLSSTYLNKLKTYADPNAGSNKFAAAGNFSDIILGIPDDLGNAGSVTDPTKALQGMAMISGALGVGLAYAASTATGATFLASISPTIASTSVPTLVPASVNPAGVVLGPGLEGLGGALAGAAIGFAVVALLIKFLGIGPGLPSVVVYGLMLAGTFAGAVAGANIIGVSSTSSLGFLANPALVAVAWVVAIVVIAVIVIFAILGIGKTKKVKVSFTCNPWQPPAGGAKCGQCGKDVGNAFGVNSLPCSKYACQALGQTCQFINEGTGQEACVDISPNDVNSPVIKPLQDALQPGYSYTNVNSNGYTLKSDEIDGCLKAYATATLGIETNEPAQCEMDVQHTDKFEDMEFDFGGRSIYLINHTTVFAIPSLESLGLPGYDPNRKVDYSLYVRCQDKKGNKNVAEYSINFCVKPGDDVTPPIVTAREPVSEFTAFGATNISASIFVNEPSDCRWDSVDRDYDLMNNSLSCDNDLEDQELHGWRCSNDFPLSKNESKFYIRCKDQPWLVEAQNGEAAHIVVNNSNLEIDPELISDDADAGEAVASADTIIPVSSAKHRNKNTQSYLLNFKTSSSKLNINSVSPNNQTLVYGTQPVSVNVEVKTSGGVDGNAKCEYQIGDNFIAFFETFGKVHKQTFQSFLSGDKALPIRCEDVAGNVAEATSKFTINLDSESPKVTRIYNQAGSLVVITNEPSQCYSSIDSCEFNIENATIMTGSDVVHSGEFDTNNVNYVKCKDNFGNIPGSCSIAVRKGSI